MVRYARSNTIEEYIGPVAVCWALPVAATAYFFALRYGT